MTLSHGRVIKSAGAAPRVSLTEATEVNATRPLMPTGRRIPRVEMEAHERAREILRDAEEGASAIRERAQREGEEAARAEFAASYVMLRAREEARHEADLARAVELAKVLAERLLGEALAQDPSTIVRMAEVALREARGTRRVKIEAHPLDTAALRSDISRLSALQEIIAIEENDQLARGSLTLTTDLGTIDAKLSPQLERLGRALQDALASERKP